MMKRHRRNTKQTSSSRTTRQKTAHAPSDPLLHFKPVPDRIDDAFNQGPKEYTLKNMKSLSVVYEVPNFWVPPGSSERTKLSWYGTRNWTNLSQRHRSKIKEFLKDETNLQFKNAMDSYYQAQSHKEETRMYYSNEQQLLPVRRGRYEFTLTMSDEECDKYCFFDENDELRFFSPLVDSTVHDLWSTREKHLPCSYYDLFEDRKTSADIVIACADGKKECAHRIVLSRAMKEYTKSETWQRNFLASQQRCEECGTEPRPYELDVRDASGNLFPEGVVNAFLLYVYNCFGTCFKRIQTLCKQTDSSELEMATELFRLCIFYGVDTREIFAYCCQLLQPKLRPRPFALDAANLTDLMNYLDFVTQHVQHFTQRFPPEHRDDPFIIYLKKKRERSYVDACPEIAQHVNERLRGRSVQPIVKTIRDGYTYLDRLYGILANHWGVRDVFSSETFQEFLRSQLPSSSDLSFGSMEHLKLQLPEDSFVRTVLDIFQQAEKAAVPYPVGINVKTDLGYVFLSYARGMYVPHVAKIKNWPQNKPPPYPLSCRITKSRFMDMVRGYMVEGSTFVRFHAIQYDHHHHVHGNEFLRVLGECQKQEKSFFSIEDGENILDEEELCLTIVED